MRNFKLGFWREFGASAISLYPVGRTCVVALLQLPNRCTQSVAADNFHS